MGAQQEKNNQELWAKSRYNFQYKIENFAPRGGQKASNSLSGKESNQMFLAHDGNFIRISAVSGTDTRQDSRGFALLDYDQDGWTDIVQINLTKPRVRLLRNQFFKLFPDRKSLELTLVGTKSNRDAIGAVADVTFSDKSLQRYQIQCGRGFSTQNSRKLRIPVSPERTISDVLIRWPSGAMTKQENIQVTQDQFIFHESDQ